MIKKTNKISIQDKIKQIISSLNPNLNRGILKYKCITKITISLNSKIIIRITVKIKSSLNKIKIPKKTNQKPSITLSNHPKKNTLISHKKNTLISHKKRINSSDKIIPMHINFNKEYKTINNKQSFHPSKKKKHLSTLKTITYILFNFRYHLMFLVLKSLKKYFIINLPIIIRILNFQLNMSIKTVPKIVRRKLAP